MSSSTSSKPRLLFLAHRFPHPLNRGDRIRSFNLIRFLATTCDIYLGTPSEEEISQADQLAVRAYCQDIALHETSRRKVLWNTARSFVSGKSLTEGYFFSRELQQHINTWQQQQSFDLVFVYCSSMYPYVDNELFRKTPKLVDLVDVDSQKWQQLAEKTHFPKNWVYHRESKCVRVLEQQIARESDGLILISEDEVDVFHDNVARTEVKAVNNGVDSEFFSPASRPRDDSGKVCRLIFTGALDYEPNLDGLNWFCDEVWTSLRATFGSRICLDIIGRNPTPLAMKLGGQDGVTIHANVPSVQKYMQAADISVCPLHLARGIQNKVLEAMACGLPTIVAPQSAEGIQAIDGAEIVIADQAEEWIQCVSKLVEDKALRAKIGHTARIRIEEGYSWKARLAPVNEILNHFVGGQTNNFETSAKTAECKNS